MKYATIAVRTLLGLAFVLFGLAYFLKLMPEPEPGTFPPDAGAYLGLLAGSGYMTVVKVCELLGGALVLSGRFTPLGLVVLVPVLVNVLLFEVCFTGKPGISLVFLALCGFLMVSYRAYFLPFFAGSAVR